MTKRKNWLRRNQIRNQLFRMLPWLDRVAEWRNLLIASKRWRIEGYFTPVPYFIRRAQLIQVGKRIGADSAVETGTFRGDTTFALSKSFREVHTIEVVPLLADMARARFRTKKSVKVWNGDSPDVLRSLLPTLDSCLLFYLDGHDSGGITGKGRNTCPVKEELEVIYSLCPGRVSVVIDDARLFGSDPDYPTLSEIQMWMKKLRPNSRVSIEHDAIVIEDNT